jgi:multiple sugar transport system substrate-binding protein
VMDSDVAVSALQNFVRMRPHSDPSSYTYYWADVFSSLASETAANGLLWHDYLNWFDDQARSLVPHKMAVKQNPSGPQGSFSTFGGAGVGVSRFSKNPEMAWLWLQWATAKGTQATILLDQYHILPTRTSVFSIPQVSNVLQTDAYAIPRLAESIFQSGSIVALTPFPKWYKVSQALSFFINQAWVGKLQPRDALTQAKAKIETYGSLTFT